MTRCQRQPIKKRHMINRHRSNLKKKNRHTLPNHGSKMDKETCKCGGNYGPPFDQCRDTLSVAPHKEGIPSIVMVQKRTKKLANVGATTVHRSISAVTRCHRQPIKKRHMINRHGSNLKKKNRHTLPNLNHTRREMTGWEGGREGREGREGGREGGRLSWAAVGALLCCVVL